MNIAVAYQNAEFKAENYFSADMKFDCVADLFDTCPKTLNGRRVVSLTEFLRLVAEKKIDGILIAEDFRKPLSWQMVTLCQRNRVNRIGIIDSRKKIFWLSRNKSFMPHLETHVTDICNLNCKGCSHFANLFTEPNIYDLRQFQKDLARIAECFDVIRFRLMGGEPFLVENIGDFVKIARACLPNTDIRIVTNGLLIPSLPEKTFECLRDNDIIVTVSVYPPVAAHLENIANTLKTFGVKYKALPVREFFAYMVPNGTSDPASVHDYCMNYPCRVLRAGKLYKCPVEAMIFKFQECFPNLYPTHLLERGIDIYSANVTELFYHLRECIELCRYCFFPARKFAWTNNSKPRAEDWFYENVQSAGH